MKNIYLLSLGILSTVIGLAQNNISSSNDLSNLSALKMNVNSSAITTFTNNAIKGNRYLYTDWKPGSITAMDNQVYAQNYTFNYDKINHDIYAKYTDGPSAVLDKTKVKSFKIGELVFVNAFLIDPKAKEPFYQVLVNDPSKISLYKVQSTKYVKADPTDMMTARTQNYSNEYVDDNKYFIKINGKNPKKINFNENEIHRVFKEYDNKVDSYFSGNSSAEVNESFLVNLVTYLNQ